MKTFKTLIIVQAGYIMATAVWPLVNIESFMLVTGYKTDIWLVKTVAALLIPIAASLASFLFIKTNMVPAFLLGSLTAIALASVDFYYALTNQISEIYIADGVIEILFLTGWIYSILKGVLYPR